MRMKMLVFALFCAVTMSGCTSVTGPDQPKSGNPTFPLPNPVVCASPIPNTWGSLPNPCPTGH